MDIIPIDVIAHVLQYFAFDDLRNYKPFLVSKRFNMGFKLMCILREKLCLKTRNKPIIDLTKLPFASSLKTLILGTHVANMHFTFGETKNLRVLKINTPLFIQSFKFKHNDVKGYEQFDFPNLQYLKICIEELYLLRKLRIPKLQQLKIFPSFKPTTKVFDLPHISTKVLQIHFPGLHNGFQIKGIKYDIFKPSKNGSSYLTVFYRAVRDLIPPPNSNLVLSFENTCCSVWEKTSFMDISHPYSITAIVPNPKHISKKNMHFIAPNNPKFFLQNIKLIQRNGDIVNYNDLVNLSDITVDLSDFIAKHEDYVLEKPNPKNPEWYKQETMILRDIYECFYNETKNKIQQVMFLLLQQLLPKDKTCNLNLVYLMDFVKYNLKVITLNLK